MNQSDTTSEDASTSFRERLQARDPSYWKEELSSRLTKTDGPLEDDEFSSLLRTKVATCLDVAREDVAIAWYRKSPSEVRANERHGVVLVDFIVESLSVQLHAPLAVAVFTEELLISVGQQKPKRYGRKELLESLADSSKRTEYASSLLRDFERVLLDDLAELTEAKHSPAPWVEKRTTWLDPTHSPLHVEAFTWALESLTPELKNLPTESELKEPQSDRARLVVWSDGDVSLEGINWEATLVYSTFQDADHVRGNARKSGTPAKLDIEECGPSKYNISTDATGAVEKWRISVNTAEIGELNDEERVGAGRYFFLNHPLKSSIEFYSKGCNFVMGPASTESYNGKNLLDQSRKRPLGLLNGRLEIQPSEQTEITGTEARTYAEMTLHLLTIASGTVTRIVTERQYAPDETSRGLRARPQRAALHPVGSEMFHKKNDEEWSDFFQEALPMVLHNDDVMDRIDITALQWGSINSLPFLDNRIGQTAIATEGLIRYIAISRLDDQFKPVDDGVLARIRKKGETHEASFGYIANQVHEHLGVEVDTQLKDLWKTFRNGFAHHGSLHEHEEDLFHEVYVPLRRHYQELILAWIGWEGDYRKYGEGFTS